jgi:adenylate kinase
MRNLIFIGGIHGAGKGTLCKKICIELNLIHLSASEVLKWNEISDLQNKLVSDFTVTQNRLINNLTQIVNGQNKYLLDGHYCLLNNEQEPQKIEEETFNLIDPYAFVVVVDLISQIKSRLESRDGLNYDYKMLEKFQDMEVSYSMELANKLSKPHVIIENGDYSKLKKLINYENFA